MSTYAIGDIQGCFDELCGLLEVIDFNPDRDKLWFVGDLINRGPKNLETLRFIRQLGDGAVVVLGNHDLHFLAVHEGQHRSMRSDTLEDLPRCAEVDELATWLRHQPLIHHDSDLNYTMVHAGIPPIWDLDQACARAREVETVLRSSQYREFLNHMYGNEPDNWQPDLEGMDRFRVITNYLTRLRFCKSDGQVEMTHKETAAPPGFAPWFQHPRPKHAKLRLIFGHWAALQGSTGGTENVFAVDTGCVWGRELTALGLETGELFTHQAPA